VAKHFSHARDCSCSQTAEVRKVQRAMEFTHQDHSTSREPRKLIQPFTTFAINIRSHSSRSLHSIYIRAALNVLSVCGDFMYVSVITYTSSATISCINLYLKLTFWISRFFQKFRDCALTQNLFNSCSNFTFSNETSCKVVLCSGRFYLFSAEICNKEPIIVARR